MDRIDAEGQTERDDQRNDDHRGREDVHQAADEEQKDVQQQQEEDLRFDVVLGEFNQTLGRLRVHQPARQSHRHDEDDQHPADQHGALPEHREQRLPHLQVAVDDALDDEGVEGRQRRRLDQGRVAAEDRAHDDDREEQLPLSRPDGLADLRSRDPGTASAAAQAFSNAPGSDQRDQEQAGEDPPNEQILDRHLRDDAEQNERQGRR